MVPRPLRPSTPDECVVVHIMIASCRSAAATSSGSGPMSPSIENTPSVISSLRPAFAVEFRPVSAPPPRVLMGEHVDLGAAQSRAIDDAGVVQFIGNNVIVRRQNRRDRSCVCLNPD